MILALDPGLRSCGFAVLYADELLDLGVLATSDEGRIIDRLAELADDLCELSKNYRPSEIVAESPTWPRDASSAAKLAAAFGLIMGVARYADCDFTPLSTGEWRRLLELPAEKLPRAPKVSADDKAAGKAREKQRREAKGRRKAATEAYMRARWPGAAARLESVQTTLHEHAWDALAIGTARLVQLQRRAA